MHIPQTVKNIIVCQNFVESHYLKLIFYKGNYKLIN